VQKQGESRAKAGLVTGHIEALGEEGGTDTGLIETTSAGGAVETLELLTGKGVGFIV
jgi:hypothetical protein